MRRLYLSICLVALAIAASAQTRFGYFSYSQVCKQMPEYEQAQQSLIELRGTFDKEAKHNEEEFQRKFNDFLEGQKDFPTNILQKRQAELQDLMDKSINFRRECEALLTKAETDLLKTVEAKLNEAVRQVGLEKGFPYIANTDGNALPFINPDLGVDVTKLVLVKLGLAEPDPEPEPEPAPETTPEETTTSDAPAADSSTTDSASPSESSSANN